MDHALKGRCQSDCDKQGLLVALGLAWNTSKTTLQVLCSGCIQAAERLFKNVSL